MRMNPVTQEIIQELVDELYGRSVMSNLTRPIFIEKLLLRLLKGNWQHVGGDWSWWDLQNTHSGARIELKQSAARQTWMAQCAKENQQSRYLISRSALVTSQRVDRLGS